jgi:hypothetical protein
MTQGELLRKRSRSWHAACIVGLWDHHPAIEKGVWAMKKVTIRECPV